ncbi:Putative ATP-binding protein [Sulfurovum sp. enrichment culture clone C5]|uniref:Putative ATP-binding protein n=1 Tax=Sulfurovum sp. enrichment culture clone C5 TaxID=497650 RepID=A0A0S4XMH3_9BACT|nr:Putative ATP-binding protein [Sulfurovum sp. enrichment culture clone C5]
MYHPYLRGKQNELILLRENAKLLSSTGMIPIIEPVKTNLAPLEKAIESLMDENVSFVLIINPRHGELKNNPLPIFDKINNLTSKANYENFTWGYIVDPNSSLLDVKDFLDKFTQQPITFIHDGFTKGKDFAVLLEDYSNIRKHIFLDNQKLYQKAFKKEDIERVLIRDGFKKQDANKDYPEDELFSELHLTYEDEGMNGFGDFLIVGDNYSDGGGPAYAVTLHLTYIDNEDDLIHIKHFISDTTNTPKDPAGKFAEALSKLVERVEEDELIYKSDAYKQYKDFYDREHFPGLGVAKKLSMQHHIETLAKFLSK